MLNERFDTMINIEREGVSTVQRIVYKDLGWIFREQTVADFGIDAEIEVAGQKYPTGKMIAVQIKSGSSYFSNVTEEGFTFGFDEKHKKYWLGHVLPVVVLLYHPDRQECIWEVVNEFTVKKTSEKRYKLVIPKEKQFGESKKIELLILAYSQNITDLAEDIDELDVDKQTVFSMLDDGQKTIFDEARNEIDKKNASSDKVLFEFKREEFSDFVSATKWFDIKNDIIIGKQTGILLNHLEDFAYDNKQKSLIILGEAGIGKTTLVKIFMEKYLFPKEILYIQCLGFHKDIMNIVRHKYDMNRAIRIIIIDGWDETDLGLQRIEIWQELQIWRKYHENIKLIITARHMEEYVWKNECILRMEPYSKEEALYFLKLITEDQPISEEVAQRAVDIFNTPLMLQTYVMAINQLDIAPEEATLENFLFASISRYSLEASKVLENLAFKMMQENEMFVSLEDNSNLMHLGYYAELCIQDGKVAFSHKIFYELFAAMYIVRHIFKGEKEPEKFSYDAWQVFSHNLCSIDILNYVKFIIKHERISNAFVKRLNYTFKYMLNQGMIQEYSNDTRFFEAISNVFYMMWHIVSYVNRMYYGIFRPEFSKNEETNLSCLINIFNKIYFGKVYLDFSHTNLTGVKMWRCNLTNVNFRKSMLHHTNFLGSSMDGSNFQQADLSFSNFVATDLRHVNLKDAILTGANVGNCMISEDSLKYFLPYKDSLRNIKKLIVFMNDGTIKYFFDSE